jgi:hypothetical protein
MVTRSADDFDVLSKRLVELRAERREQLKADCSCPTEEREDGVVVKLHQIGCVHFVATSGPSGFVLQQPRRMPDDDWRALKEQAQSVEAAFLQRLHLRIEAARPRSFWAPK